MGQEVPAGFEGGGSKTLAKPTQGVKTRYPFTEEQL